MEAIAQEIVQLPNLLKEQPKRLSQFHLMLLRHKLRQMSQVLEDESHEEDSPGYRQINDIPERKVLLTNGFF